MESTYIPNLVEREVIKGVSTYFINIDIFFNGNMYEYEPIEVKYERWDYGGIIDALVTYKYTNDKMQSIINNYLLEPDNAEYIQEFNDMQAWRKEAKEIAKQALDYNNK